MVGMLHVLSSQVRHVLRIELLFYFLLEGIPSIYGAHVFSISVRYRVAVRTSMASSANAMASK